MTIDEAKRAVLDLISEAPMRPRDIRNALVRRGFRAGQARTAIARLWDAGVVNVGVDQLVRPV